MVKTEFVQYCFTRLMTLINAKAYAGSIYVNIEEIPQYFGSRNGFRHKGELIYYTCRANKRDNGCEKYVYLKKIFGD